MARKVIWTDVAWSDLQEIADYIAKDSANYAAGFVLEVRDAARSLMTFADRGHMVPEFHDPTIRELFVGNYRLVYQVATSSVCILGLIHGARDPESLWKATNHG